MSAISRPGVGSSVEGTYGLLGLDLLIPSARRVEGSQQVLLLSAPNILGQKARSPKTLNPKLFFGLTYIGTSHVVCNGSRFEGICVLGDASETATAANGIVFRLDLRFLGCNSPEVMLPS